MELQNPENNHIEVFMLFIVKSLVIFLSEFSVNKGNNDCPFMGKTVLS